MKDLEPWALSLSGTQLIEASAGTGKTYTLTTLYLRLLVERDLRPSEILVVTYTNAAAAELRERIRARIREAMALCDRPSTSTDPADGNREPELRELALGAQARAEASGTMNPLRRALQEFDEAAIFTIHGFCQRTLQENAFESGLSFDAELVEDSEILQRTLAHDLWSRLLEGEEPEFIEWLRFGAGRRWEFEPEDLKRSILGLLGADEDMPILPASADASASADLSRLWIRAAEIWPRWAKGWRARREVVTGILLGESDLNRNTYRVASIESRWLPQFDAWERELSKAGDARSMNAVELPNWWKNVVPSGLEKGVKKGGRPIRDPFFDLCGELEDALNELEAARRSRALDLRVRFTCLAREEARKRRAEQHLLFFDDLLSSLRDALRSTSGDELVALLRARYRFALIDEFQDTDPVQYEIFRRVWHDAEGSQEDRGLLLIGDPKQAIYAFRNADVFTYLTARDDAHGGLHGLAVNWRSRARVIAATNTLFAQPRAPFGYAGIEFNPVSAAPGSSDGLVLPNRPAAGLRVLMADRERAIELGLADASAKKKFPVRFGRTTLMQGVARDIADLLECGGTIEGRPIRASDIAILCRRKLELASARRALEALGIPCVDRGDADVFDSREAWELLSVMRAWLRPSDPALMRAALSTGAHGRDAEAIRLMRDDSIELAEIAERFAAVAQVWQQSGFGLAFESWRRRESIGRCLLGYRDGERRLTNWLHLAELLQTVESEQSTSRSGLVAWLERAIATSDARGEVASEASLLRLERDDEAVSLVTLHRSKGLEYEFVYLPSLYEKSSKDGPSAESGEDDLSKRRPPIRFFDEAEGKRTLDLGGEQYAEHARLARDETLSEEARLLYVGLTRAKQQCVLCWGAVADDYVKTPIAWLLHARAWEAEGKDRDSSPAELRKWSDERWVEAWQAIADEASQREAGAIEVERVDYQERPRSDASKRANAGDDRTDSSTLVFDERQRVLGAPSVTTSFSGLVRDAHRTSEPMAGPTVTGQDRFDGSAASPIDVIDEPELVPDLACAMHEFPRGAAAGTLLHEVLEQVDFTALDRTAIRELARKKIEHGRVGTNHETYIDQMLHVAESIARTPLRPAPDPFCLGDVPNHQQRPEIEFTLAAPGAGPDSGFSPSSLAAILRDGASDSPLARYAERAARLGWRTLHGFLRGFIDSVFHDGERYYLIDYKSNFLGSRQVDYLPDQLMQPMIEHDYVLQYLIYTVALDRHLSQRLTGYDYDVHFGGAYYLFLRGVAETHHRGCGVFFDRPSRDVIRRVSALLGDASVGVSHD